jgi:hypothetical protein
MESLAQVSQMTRSFGGVVVLILGAVALYYLYQFLFTSNGMATTSLITTSIAGNTAMKDLLPISPPYEGGEYSVSFWMYVTAFNKDLLGKHKHILEIKGTNKSMMVVGLGSITNTLIVRVNTYTGSSPTSDPLSKSKIPNLFDTKVYNSGLTENLELCDLPEVQLQKWVSVAVVLSGKTCDVYMDGKLTRSCVLPNFYRVDSTGVKMKLLDYGGFEGYLGDVSTYNYALNPDQIYRMYMTGPTDNQSSFLSWIQNIFDVKGQLSIRYPTPAVQYATTQVNLP